MKRINFRDHLKKRRVIKSICFIPYGLRETDEEKNGGEHVLLNFIFWLGSICYFQTRDLLMYKYCLSWASSCLLLIHVCFT